jgi:exosortase
MSLEADNPSPSVPARRFRYSEASGGSVSAAAAIPFGSGALPAMDWTRIWWILVAAAACFYLLYASNIQILISKWASDSGWSHGFVVPLICVFFIRMKWDTLRLMVPQGTWVGLVLLLIGICAQVLFRATGMIPMSPLTMLVIFIGVVLFVFGWEYLKILWLPIAYLAFAMPPPDPVYVQVTMPMQGMAARLGAILLSLFGYAAERRGTVIDMFVDGKVIPLNVEQACAGMRMLVAFFALSVALAYSTSRPVWQKLVLAGCALPIAILCNGTRVALTGVMMVQLGDEWGKGKAHEWLGLLMLGPAMAMQLGIAWVLDRIFVETPDAVDGAVTGGAA